MVRRISISISVDMKTIGKIDKYYLKYEKQMSYSAFVEWLINLGIAKMLELKEQEKGANK
ncbi:MAG: hypothetical protein DRN12_07875 [Thermoplasmata archaeon]|nr:MAG: hypothetical protein DRN12_07875 [Thermoplasmata archaeon]